MSTDAAATDAPTDLVGAELSGGWRVLRHVGEGGMAHVYEAEREGTRAAIKLLHQPLVSKPEVAFRFRREGELVESIDSPYVPRVLGRGKDPSGRPWIAFEFVPGRELSDILEERGKLPARTSLVIARQIAEALRAAHHAGIVHRDMKPDNVLVDGDLDGDPDGVRAKVLDFSVSKDEDLAFTQQGLVIGTPMYMAVEQAMGETVTPAVDIYSLGAILYDMLGGRPPYEPDEPRRVLAALLTKAPQPLATLDPTIPPALTAVVDRAMARAAKDRYPMIESMIDALEEAALAIEPPDADGRPSLSRLSLLGVPLVVPMEPQAVLAPPPSRFAEPARAGRPWLVLGAVAVALLALLALVLLKASS